MLNADKVHALFLELLFKSDEIDQENHRPKEGDFLKVEGITQIFGLHPGRVSEHKAEIQDMLQDIDPKFDEGYSFLQLPFDKDGNQWCEQPTAQELMVMGIATEELAYCFPREMWSILPGSVPYIIRKEVKSNG